MASIVSMTGLASPLRPGLLMNPMLGLMFSLMLSLPPLAFPQDPPSGGRITVTGTAEIKMIPDTVSLALGIETEEPEISTAREVSARRTAAVLAVIKDFGIPEHQVQTAHLEIEPRDDYKQQKRIGYRVRRTLSVSLQDLRQFEDFLAALLEAGTVRVRNLQFGHSQLAEQRDQALLMALSDARRKAEALAEEFDQIPGPPLMIVAAGEPGTLPLQTRGNLPTALDSAVQETLAPGQITVRAAVTVTFSLQDYE